LAGTSPLGLPPEFRAVVRKKSSIGYRAKKSRQPSAPVVQTASTVRGVQWQRLFQARLNLKNAQRTARRWRQRCQDARIAHEQFRLQSQVGEEQQAPVGVGPRLAASQRELHDLILLDRDDELE